MSSHISAQHEHPFMHFEASQVPLSLHAIKQQGIHAFGTTPHVPTTQQAEIELTRDTSLLNAAQSQMDWTKYHSAIRLPDVLEMVNLSRSTWYALLDPKSKTFDEEAPRPFKIGRSSFWLWIDVAGYVLSKSRATRVN